MKLKKLRLTRHLSAALLPALLIACSTPRHPAPVVDRPLGPKPADTVKQVPAASTLSSPKQADSRGYYVVRKGDTLLQIALDFGQNYRDLVAWNDLSNPNDIRVDQSLRVMPPEGAAQTASVNPAGGVEVRPLPAAASSPPSTMAPVNKSTPRGEKKAYSEGVLAELQKPDTTVLAPSNSPTVAKADKAAEIPHASSEDENIAWIWPADGKIIVGFGEGKRGVDIAGKLGQPVLAAGAGKVLYAGNGIRGYGNLVIVKHSANLLSAYAHNKTIFVKEDQSVTKGQKIAEMGNSDADEVKLHFEIRQQGKPVDPSKFLPNR